MTPEQRKEAQRLYQSRYQKSAKGRAKARQKMGPGGAWREAHAARLAVTRELAKETGRARERWSDEEDAQLTKLRAKGTSYREIATIMWRSQQSVQRRAEKLKITAPRVWPKRPKPIAVGGATVAEVLVDELHKFMRRRKAFTFAELVEHCNELELGDLSTATDVSRMLDNLLRRDKRAGRVRSDGRVRCVGGDANGTKVQTTAWHWLGDPEEQSP